MCQACQIKSCYLLKDCKNSYHNVVLPFLLSVNFIRVHTTSIYSFKLTVFAAEWDYVYINMWQTYRKFVLYLMYSWESIITFSWSFKVIVLPKMIYQPWNILFKFWYNKSIFNRTQILYLPSRPAWILSTRNCTHKLFNVWLLCICVDFDLNFDFLCRFEKIFLTWRPSCSTREAQPRSTPISTRWHTHASYSV